MSPERSVTYVSGRTFKHLQFRRRWQLSPWCGFGGCTSSSYRFGRCLGQTDTEAWGTQSVHPQEFDSLRIVGSCRKHAVVAAIRDTILGRLIPWSCTRGSHDTCLPPNAAPHHCLLVTSGLPTIRELIGLITLRR